MIQYISLNVKLSKLQLNKFKYAINNEVVLRKSSHIIRNSNDESNFPKILLLTNRQVPNFHKDFGNSLSTDIELSKTLLPKMMQSRGFLARIFGTLLKPRLPLMKTVIIPLPKSVLEFH